MNLGPEDGSRRGGLALEAMYGLTLWLIPTLEHFPRRQKFLLGDRIQTTAVASLESLAEATFTRRRARCSTGCACCCGSRRTCATSTGGATSMRRGASNASCSGAWRPMR